MAQARTENSVRNQKRSDAFGIQPQWTWLWMLRECSACPDERQFQTNELPSSRKNWRSAGLMPSYSSSDQVKATVCNQSPDLVCRFSSCRHVLVDLTRGSRHRA